MMIDKTHDPALQSWVESANRPGCDFPIQNLPVGVFQVPEESRTRLGIAIGDFILDAGEWLAGDVLDGYVALSATQRRDLRQEWSNALEAGSGRATALSTRRVSNAVAGGRWGLQPISTLQFTTQRMWADYSDRIIH